MTSAVADGNTQRRLATEPGVAPSSSAAGEESTLFTPTSLLTVKVHYHNCDSGTDTIVPEITAADHRFSSNFLRLVHRHGAVAEPRRAPVPLWLPPPPHRLKACISQHVAFPSQVEACSYPAALIRDPPAAHYSHGQQLAVRSTRGSQLTAYNLQRSAPCPWLARKPQLAAMHDAASRLYTQLRVGIGTNSPHIG